MILQYRLLAFHSRILDKLNYSFSVSKLEMLFFKKLWWAAITRNTFPEFHMVLYTANLGVCNDTWRLNLWKTFVNRLHTISMVPLLPRGLEPPTSTTKSRIIINLISITNSQRILQKFPRLPVHNITWCCIFLSDFTKRCYITIVSINWHGPSLRHSPPMYL